MTLHEKLDCFLKDEKAVANADIGYYIGFVVGIVTALVAVWAAHAIQ